MYMTGFGSMLAGGFSIFLLFLLWFTCLGMGIYLFVLVVKLARRGIIALDLYNHSKKIWRSANVTNPLGGEMISE
ncbi:hypothetical protein ACFTAO_17900 [Paenibacillus rhizoplanae]